jgi:hypothetical protein
VPDLYLHHIDAELAPISFHILPMLQHKYQSFRLACDRCRQHKLKCSQNKSSTVTHACQRCLRAKLPCRFSPRRRIGRPSETKTIEASLVEDKRGESNSETRHDKSCAAGSSSGIEDGHGDDADVAESHVLSTKQAKHQMETAKIADPQWAQYGAFERLLATREIQGDTDLSTLDLDSIVDYVNGMEWGEFTFPTSTTTNSTGLSIQDTNAAEISTACSYVHEMDYFAGTHKMAQTTFNPIGVPQIVGAELPSLSQNKWKFRRSLHPDAHCTCRGLASTIGGSHPQLVE